LLASETLKEYFHNVIFRSSWRDVYITAAARGGSVCGDMLAATALVLTLQSRGYGGLAVAGVLLAEALPLVILAPLTGRLADRADSRTLLVAAGFGQAAVCVVLAYTSHPVLIIGLVALLTCGLAITSPTFAALVPEMVGRKDFARASALNQTASAVGLLAGPALAGVLVGQYGARPALLLDAVSYLAILAAGLSIRTRRGSSERRAASLGGEPRSSRNWRLRSDPLLGPLVLALGMVVAAVTAINVVDVFFVRETLGATATWFGLVAATWTGGMLAGAWIVARWVQHRDEDCVLGQGSLLLLAGSCVAVLAAAAVPAVGWLIPIWLVGGITNGGENTVLTVLMARRAPEEVRGRAFAQLAGVAQGGSVVGYLLGGVLLAWITPRPIVAMAGAAGLLVIAAVAGPVMRAARRDGVTVGDATAEALAGSAAR
jgi:MFS family permease